MTAAVAAVCLLAICLLAVIAALLWGFALMTRDLAASAHTRETEALAWLAKIEENTRPRD